MYPDQVTNLLVDARVTDLDTQYQVWTNLEKVIAAHEKTKKKYLELCLEQCHHFTTFTMSTDKILGRKATTIIRRLALKLQ